MATPDESEQSADTELAGAVHRILAILTDLRRDMPAPELRDRIVLVRWLRAELAEVETLLGGAYGRSVRAEEPGAEPVRRA